MDKIQSRSIENIRRDERYTEDLQRRGVSKNFYDANGMITCPDCGTSFSLFYSRAKLCTGCPSSITGCEYARCTHCDSEFPLNNIMSKTSTRAASDYMGSVVKRYNSTFGYSQWE